MFTIGPSTQVDWCREEEGWHREIRPRLRRGRPGARKEGEKRKDQLGVKLAGEKR